MNTIIKFFLISLLYVLFGGFVSTDSYLWQMDSLEEIKSFGHDGSGAVFEIYNEKSVSGTASMQVIPSGSSGETKIALPLQGEKVSQWLGHQEVQLRIYRPESNHLNPGHFFMGMSDVTGGSWNWKGGTTWNVIELQPGWNEITYSLPEGMQNLQEGNDYTLFLAFSTYMPPREDGIRVPLYEYFLIDGIKML